MVRPAAKNAGPLGTGRVTGIPCSQSKIAHRIGVQTNSPLPNLLLSLYERNDEATFQLDIYSHFEQTILQKYSYSIFFGA